MNIYQIVDCMFWKLFRTFSMCHLAVYTYHYTFNICLSWMSSFLSSCSLIKVMCPFVEFEQYVLPRRYRLPHWIIVTNILQKKNVSIVQHHIIIFYLGQSIIIFTSFISCWITADFHRKWELYFVILISSALWEWSLSMFPESLHKLMDTNITHSLSPLLVSTC